jgi:predicted nicotinamide N-methyase
MTTVSLEPQAAAAPAARLTPDRIFTTLSAYERTAALAAAIELDLFTTIGAGATTAEALAERIQASPRGTRILADYLVVDGFLTKRDGRYGLSAEAAAFLDRRSPAYLGSVAGFLAAPTLTRRCERLADAVRRGGTVATDDEQLLTPEHPMWVEFARSMAPMMGLVAARVAEVVGRATRVLDIAAGHGLYGLSVARTNREARVVAVDWPNVLTVARENAERMGLADRLELRPGSAFEVDYGTGYDLALVTNFLHHFDPETNVRLLAKVCAALGPGGRGAIVEFIPDETRVSPPIAAAFSLKMLAGTPAGDAYTYSELDGMCRDAGFAGTALERLPPLPHSVVVANR